MTIPTDRQRIPEAGRPNGRRHLAIVHGQAAPRPTLAAPHSLQAGSSQVGSLQAGSLQVGELAKETGKTVRAIHLYESMGLLQPTERTRGRFRLFNQDSVQRVRWIGKLQAVGFSLPEIQEIVREQESAGSAIEAAQRLRDVYLERLSAVQTKLAELHRLEHELLSSLTYLDACRSACTPDVPAESCPSCGKHLDQPEQPSLVSGLHAT